MCMWHYFPLVAIDACQTLAYHMHMTHMLLYCETKQLLFYMIITIVAIYMYILCISITAKPVVATIRLVQQLYSKMLLKLLYCIAGKFGGRRLWWIYHNRILARKSLANLPTYLNRFVLDEKIWQILVWRNTVHSPNSTNFPVIQYLKSFNPMNVYTCYWCIYTVNEPWIIIIHECTNVKCK